MTGRLILVRHGQTLSNVEHKLDTVLPGAELTPRGIDQAKAVGAQLVRDAPVALITSRALRAQQTAHYIGAEVGLEPELAEGLFEAQAGDHEGRNDVESIALYRKTFVAWLNGDVEAAQPGGESGQQVLDRYLPTVERLRTGVVASGQTAVVVSHGAAIRFVATHLGGIDPTFAARAYLENTGTVVLAAEAERWRVLEWGGQPLASSESMA